MVVVLVKTISNEIRETRCLARRGSARRNGSTFGFGSYGALLTDSFFYCRIVYFISLAKS